MGEKALARVPRQSIHDYTLRTVRKVGLLQRSAFRLYPPERFDQALPHLADACAPIAPFAVTLAGFRLSLHPSRRATLWLAPEPGEGLVRLQAALQAACP